MSSLNSLYVSSASRKAGSLIHGLQLRESTRYSSTSGAMPIVWLSPARTCLLGSSKNSRILDVTNNTISYDYKDYRNGGKHNVKTESIDTFLNLLSQHILPNRFVRIRHYGILSPCNREVLRNIQQQLNVPPVPKVRKKQSYLEICNEKGLDIGICKDCHCQRIIMRIIKPAPRAPPSVIWHIGH